MHATDDKRTLQRVPASDPEKLIEVLRIDGCAIITEFTTPELVSQVNADTKPWLEKDKPWKGALFPPETRRCPRLISRSKTAREIWLLSPVIDTLTKYFLSKTTSNYYDDELHTYTTDPIVSICATLEINPGAKAQRLHRDDKNHHTMHEDQTLSGYRKGTETMMGFLIPGVETREENGATLCIPGSHLWGLDRFPRREEAVYAEMVPGEAFVMLGGCYHAGGQNSTKDVPRPMHGMFFCQGILRTEENQYIVNSPEEVLSWSPEVQRKMGYFVSSPNIGWVDFKHPIEYLSGDYDDSVIKDTDPEPIMVKMGQAQEVSVGA